MNRGLLAPSTPLSSPRHHAFDKASRGQASRAKSASCRAATTGTASLLWPSLLLASALGCSGEGDRPLVADGAAIDVHTHLASPFLANLFLGEGTSAATAEELIERLDEAHVERAVVLSAGYFTLPEEAGPPAVLMADENDFVAREVAQFPDRLLGFCGVHPLVDGALAEIDRCLALPHMVGIKLHLPGSRVDMAEPSHALAVWDIFDRAEQLDAPLLMHSNDQFNLPLGSEGFDNLFSIVKEHPRVRVVHAHCAGNIDDQFIERWLRYDNRSLPDSSFVEGSACLKFFRDAPLAVRERIVWQLRTWGIDRVLVGSDYLKFQPEETPAEALETLTRFPFTQQELDTLLDNDASAWLGCAGAAAGCAPGEGRDRGQVSVPGE